MCVVGFQVGDGFELGWYRGKHLAVEQQVVVVEHNYRVNELGFLHDDVRGRCGAGALLC